MTFDFATADRIIFGSGKIRELPSIARSFGSRVLWVCGKDPGRFAAIKKTVEDLGLFVCDYSVAGEPSLEVVATGARQCREAQCDAVVAVGGGSVLDAGKAIAALATNFENLLDYLEVIGAGRPLDHAPLPFVAIPTTSGTGAEVTRNAVLYSPEHQVKVSLRHVSMLPRVALVDPTLTLSLPRSVTISTGLDALTQLIEPFLCTKRNPMVDAFCRAAIPKSAKALPKAVANPDDLHAREDLSFCSLASGMALANAGLGAVHGFAAPIGGSFLSPHGAVCAALLPYALEVNYRGIKADPAQDELRGRFKELGELLTGRLGATAEDGLAWVHQTVENFDVPKLRTYGLTKKDLPALCDKAQRASSMKANPVPLSPDDLLEIIERAL